MRKPVLVIVIAGFVFGVLYYLRPNIFYFTLPADPNTVLEKTPVDPLIFGNPTTVGYRRGHFPKDFPRVLVYPGGQRFAFATHTSYPSGFQRFSVSYDANISLEKLRSWHEHALAEHGWSITERYISSKRIVVRAANHTDKTAFAILTTLAPLSTRAYLIYTSVAYLDHDFSL